MGILPLVLFPMLIACSDGEQPAGSGPPGIAPTPSDLLCGERPGGSIYGEHVLRLENSSGSLVVQLQRTYERNGVGASYIFRLDGFALVHEGEVRCSSEGAGFEYINSHHNFTDVARATFGGIRYELAMHIWPEPLHALTAVSDDGATLIASTELIPTGSPVNCHACPAYVPVMISELMLNNTSTHPDEIGHYGPWLELFNPSSEDVDLSGWTLSDELGERSKWRLPSLTLPRHETLVIFADGDESQGELHTNFELSTAGGEIVLTRPDGVTDGGFSFAGQRAGESLSFDWADGYALTQTPTPGVPPSE